MLARWMDALFAPKYPPHYTGRHRAPRRPAARATDLGVARATDLGLR